MTVLRTADHFAPSQDTFAAARSGWMDAFSDLEVAILRCASRVGLVRDAKKTPLAVRLGALKEVPPSPRLSKADTIELKAIASACDKLLTIRAAVVHSRLKHGTIEGSPAVLFQNSLDVADDMPMHIALTLEQLEAIQLEIAQLTSRFDAISPNPSAPPRPSPASAAGP